MTEIILFVLVSLIFIGFVYKYFKEIQAYVIARFLPDENVFEVKRQMREIEKQSEQSNIPWMNEFTSKISQQMMSYFTPLHRTFYFLQGSDNVI
jgi:hypothetical protein